MSATTVILDGEQLDELERRLAERAAEPTDEATDPNAEAAAAAAPAQAARADHDALIEHPEARRVADSLRPGPRHLFEVQLGQIETVLNDYRRRALKEVRLGRPVPPISASIEEAIVFAKIRTSLEEK